MGASIARALAARGGRVVAVSTLAGCIACAPGEALHLSELLEARAEWGDRLVERLGLPVKPRRALWSVECDALVPGARPGAIDQHVARVVGARTVVPVANAPYTEAGLRTLEARGIVAHADFVASGGGAMAYLSPRVARAADVDEARVAVDDIMGTIVRRAACDARGAYAGAVAIAEDFLRSWAPESDWPPTPPLA